MSTTRERYLEWQTRSCLPQLPIELWAEIFSYLSVNDFFSIRLVSRLFCSCINQHTSFWSLVIFNVDQCPNYSLSSDLLRNISTSNIDLVTKSNVYSHCKVYLKAQPLKNSISKRRKRRLLISNADQNQQAYLRCLSVHFESLRSFDQLQLEYLLQKRIHRFEFTYECLSTEPSLNFLIKLERLKYLKISFLHNIIELDPFTLMLINTIQEIVCLLLRIKRIIGIYLRRMKGMIFLADYLMILSQRILAIDGLTLAGLLGISLLGDCLCFGRPVSYYVLSNPYLRALTDNFTHGMISLFATSFLVGWTRPSLLILAFIAGSFVDIDHFIEVRSFSLHRALHDQPRGRPFLHNSSLLLCITLILFIFEHFFLRYQHVSYALIFFLGWSTHHLRDAQRRGLTFVPIGETPPIEYYLPIMTFVLVTMKLFQIGFLTKASRAVNFSIV